MWHTSYHTKRETNRSLPLRVMVAPSIKSPNLTMRLACSSHPNLCRLTSGLDPAGAYFDCISQRYRFYHLSGLPPNDPLVTIPSFEILNELTHSEKVIS